MPPSVHRFYFQIVQDSVVAPDLRTVVRQENNDRVVRELELLELRQQAADIVVDVRHHAIKLRGVVVQ